MSFRSLPHVRGTPRAAVGSRIHRSGYALNELVLGQLKESHSLIAIHDWEVPQEIVEGVAFFDIVKKRLNGNPCACEARHPMHNFRIDRDHVCNVGSLLGCHIYSLGQTSPQTVGWPALRPRPHGTVPAPAFFTRAGQRKHSRDRTERLW
jgi:hypothetical protein